MPKRNKLVVLLLLPVAVFLWSIGWSLSRLGTKKEILAPKESNTQREQSALTFTMIVPEQQIAK